MYIKIHRALTELFLEFLDQTQEAHMVTFEKYEGDQVYYKIVSCGLSVVDQYHAIEIALTFKGFLSNQIVVEK